VTTSPRRAGAPPGWRTPGRHQPRGDTAAREDGSATVLVLSVCLVVVVLATALVAVASAAVARHRAGQAADSAALAAATRALSGEDAACEAAGELAQASGAVLLTCRLELDRADVLVEVHPEGWLGRFGTATGRARAGPGAPPG